MSAHRRSAGSMQRWPARPWFLTCASPQSRLTSAIDRRAIRRRGSAGGRGRNQREAWKIG